MDDLQDLMIDGVAYRTRLTRKYRERKPTVLREPGRVVAFIPGLVTDVRVEAGQTVERGRELLVFEAMKMRNAITASIDGRVTAVHVEPGRRVARGDLLVEIARD